jgi:hypothetical protein
MPMNGNTRSAGSRTPSPLPTSTVGIDANAPVTNIASKKSRRHFHVGLGLSLAVLLIFGWSSIQAELLELKQVSNVSTSSYTTGVSKTVNTTNQNDLSSPLRFCRQPTVQHNTTSTTTGGSSSSTTTTTTLKLLYQCQGTTYEQFGKQLLALAENPTNNAFWGRRDVPLPPKRTVLVLGNSHLRQVSKTMVCQYADQISSLYTASEDIFFVEFLNGAQWISITNTVLVYSKDWMRLLQDEYLQPLLLRSTSGGSSSNINTSTTTPHLDAIVFGKFTRYPEAQHTNFERTMQRDQEAYYDKRTKQQQQQQQENHLHNSTNSPTTTIDFATIPPPQLVDVVRTVSEISTAVQWSSSNHNTSSTPPAILSVPMFSLADLPRAQRERDEYYSYLEQKPSGLVSTAMANVTAAAAATAAATSDHNSTNKSSSSKRPKVHFLDTRHYIDALSLECGSDDKLTMGTCHEPNNDYYNNDIENTTTTTTRTMTPRNPADMHRCAGRFGGHADLVAWSMMEGLYELFADG